MNIYILFCLFLYIYIYIYIYICTAAQQSSLSLSLSLSLYIYMFTRWLIVCSTTACELWSRHGYPAIIKIFTCNN